MNKMEVIFFTAAIIILLVCIITMHEYYSIFIFLLGLVILYALMTLLEKYKRFENRKLSIISFIIAIILFVVYFINSVYMDFTNKGSFVDSTLILMLFMLTMIIGWLFEKNNN